MHEDIHEQILDHFENRRFGQAQYELRRRVEADEDDAPTRSLLALCLTGLEHLDEALAQARQAFVLVIALCGIVGVIVPDPLSGTLLVICLLGAAIGSWPARFLASRVPAR